MKTSEQIGELIGALAKARKEFKPVVKRQKNPFFNSRYADLAELLEGTIDALSQNGLSVVQSPGHYFNNNGTPMIVVGSLLGHSPSGQWISDELEVPLTRNPKKDRNGNFIRDEKGNLILQEVDAQGLGSAITYGRRYAYGALLNLAAEDDDGNAASRHGEEVELAICNKCGEDIPAGQTLCSKCNPKVLCADCQGVIIDYVNPKTKGVTRAATLIDKSRKRWNVALCGDCAIERAKKEQSSVIAAEQGTVKCVPTEVEGDGKKFLVHWNSGKNRVTATCWSESRGEDIQKAQGLECVFKTKIVNGYLNIEEIVSIDGVAYTPKKAVETKSA